MEPARANCSMEIAMAWLVGIGLACLGLFLFSTHRDHLFSPGMRIELGDVSLGQSNEKAFPITNHSTKPLVISAWAPTCHCMQAKFPQILVAPGQSINAYVKTDAVAPLGKRAAVIAVQWHFVDE